jgi:DNA-binding PadR family transcriptional regulator
MKHDNGLLPQVQFNILLALSLQPRHGYEIMKQVSLDSNGKISLGPGALYGSLKLLLDKGLVEEIANSTGNERRRLYKLTSSGSARLTGEITYFRSVVKLAEERTPSPRNAGNLACQ